jgi:acetoin utilization deacetylase AcuC-like enzyme/formylglycine-generating enzyme required for sulfatase activity
VEDVGVEPRTIKTSSGIEMVVIVGDWFEMGSAAGPADEMPVHKVWVSSFLIDKCEVTQDEFKKYQLPDPSHFKNPKNPLEQINWTDAAVYCNERSRAEGLQSCYDEKTWQCNFDADGYRLPTEAQWEYACRAGTRIEYSFGSNARNLRTYAWFSENSSGRTHPVGQKKPNLLGLYDMCGNVAEWCNDWYSASYYKDSPTHDPKGPLKGKERVLRGGAWSSSADGCRPARRASDPSINDTCLASDAIGFRCVRRASGNLSSDPNEKEDNPAPKNAKTGFVYSDIYLEHKTTPGHPENPARLTAIVGRLKESGLYDKLHLLTPSPISLDWLRTVHESSYIERAKQSCEDDAGYLDSMDVPISGKSFEAALMAAGGVLTAVDAVMEQKVTNAFCAVRPPGHHATPDHAMGFCIFNNVAVAAKYVQKKYGLKRVLIVDWDVHHGNGTQAVFYNDPTVLYFSVHRYPFYPGTGSEAEKGSGPGLNHTINVPLSAGAGDREFIQAFEQRLKPAALAFSPDFVLISAGFDSHFDDLLGGMQVTEQGFAQMTEIVKMIAEKCCRGRLVSVLEGGYSLTGLAASVEAHIRVLMR